MDKVTKECQFPAVCSPSTFISVRPADVFDSSCNDVVPETQFKRCYFGVDAVVFERIVVLHLIGVFEVEMAVGCH